MATGPRICEVGGKGLLFPAADSEQEWPRGLRAVLYFMGLGYIFLGVAIISDIFMSAIERITSKKVRRRDEAKKRKITALVWNPTVANLTLMALGSSAPEILLSLIELLGNGMKTRQLGPSTIVGSAAYNLLMIIAVCISAIPDGEVRRIKELRVYIVTATFSIFAYLWLIFILAGPSKNIVEIWEGMITLLFFPLLVSVAYAADRGLFSQGKEAPKLGRSRLVEARSVAMSQDLPGGTEGCGKCPSGKQACAWVSGDEGQRAVAAERPEEPAKGHVAKMLDRLRGQDTRTHPAPKDDPSAPRMSSVVPFDDSSRSTSESQHAGAIAEFVSRRHVVDNSEISVDLHVTLRNSESWPVTVGFRTRDDASTIQRPYEPAEGILEFEEGVTMRKITVHLVKDRAISSASSSDGALHFHVDLFTPSDGFARLGAHRSAKVTVLCQESPGVLLFREEEMVVNVQDADKPVKVIVCRTMGSAGRVGCSYRTENGSAVGGVDYEADQGRVEFEAGQDSAVIELRVKACGTHQRTEEFRLILEEPFGGAIFDPESDGGDDSCILTVLLETSGVATQSVDRFRSQILVARSRMLVGVPKWKDQFRDAIFRNEDEEDDDDEEVGFVQRLEVVMHWISVPWKFLFAAVPPTDFCGGWMCFVCSLCVIGALTAAVGDIAGLLGCVMGIDDSITAITLVALGTSLPDTFASKISALQEPYADASVGNVTGSNSVNVFLGLGLPFSIGSVYWVAKGADDEWSLLYGHRDFARDWQGGALVVEDENLVFSVAVFSGCGTICLLLLYARRRVVGGELGGPQLSKYASSAFLAFLWLIYVSLSSWRVVVS